MDRVNPTPWDGDIMKNALLDALMKLNPKHQFRNPVMFTVLISSILTSLLFIRGFYPPFDTHHAFTLMITLILWFTLLFANFAEAMAEGRGKAQAQALRQSRQQTMAKKLTKPEKNAPYQSISSEKLRKGDVVFVEAGDMIPCDGEIIEGIASVDESAITGESAPVIRESGGDRTAVTGGTKIISDWLIINITANPGATFLDQIISLVENAKRHKTPNELALTIVLATLTLIFLLVCSTLLPFSLTSPNHHRISLTILIALFVCLAPTTIGGLLSAIGIAGMDRMIQANVIAMSGHAIEAAGDVDILLLDKTGTITLGNREAITFIPAKNITEEHLAKAALMASLADETPEGRSIVILAKNKYKTNTVDFDITKATFIPFTAESKMSGANLEGLHIRKGAASAIKAYCSNLGIQFPQDVQDTVDVISKSGATALVVIENQIILGAIHLKDIIKGGIQQRFAQLRAMGIKTIMVTGDNPLTAAAIAAEAGVDDFFAEAKPEDKLKIITKFQRLGHLVAMTGDGTNDAPALAQADVAVAMNTGTQAAKEAGNLIDLDSNPTKLIEIVEIGKQLLMTRGALTTFSIANDVAKYFAILPAALIGSYPQLHALNIMYLSNPEHAVLSAVIFNALIIVALIPLALKGIHYKPMSAAKLLRRHVLIYGVGGLITPFIGIKIIDLFLVGLSWL